MRFGKIKADTPEPLPHVIPELKQHENCDIIRAIKVTHKYNTRYKVNYVTTFNNTPQMFKRGMTDTSTTYIDSDYIAKTYPKKDKIEVEPVAHHKTCETTGKILGYRDLVKIDPLVWTNSMSMCNELGRLSQVWKVHSGTDPI